MGMYSVEWLAWLMLREGEFCEITSSDDSIHRDGMKCNYN